MLTEPTQPDLGANQEGAERQRPPAANQGPEDVTDGDTASIPPSAHILTHDETVALSQKAVTHAHAVLVSTPAGKFQRRLFLSLHAADKAMQRARDRGLTAACVMVELVPVPGVPVIVVGSDDR